MVHWSRGSVLGAQLVLLLAPCVVRAEQSLTYHGAPYDLCEANWMGANYLQALISPRWDAVCFAHNRFGEPDGRAGLYFMDDQGRVIRSFVEEAEHGPVARVEAVAAMARGILRSRIPGTAGRYWFVLDGRQSIYLHPQGNHLTAHWLQDSPAGFATLRLEIRRGEQWETVSLTAPPHPSEVFDAETVHRAEVSGCRVEVHSLSSAYDTPPYLLVTSAEPVDVRVTVTEMGDRQHLWVGRKRHTAGPGAGLPARTREGYLLAHGDAHLSAAASAKQGWERPELWSYFDSMAMLAWQPRGAHLEARAEGSLWKEVRLEWRRRKRVRVAIAPFLELDPKDCAYVFAAAERVSRKGTFGFRPYFPVRSSNGFMGSLTGLAPAAYLLERYGHPMAARAKRAAVEAFGAIVASEGRDYHGEYGYNAISAAWYLSRVAPGRFDYPRWVRVWADRDLARCPPAWVTPPWSDTALRAIRGWNLAWRMTGDARYREAWQKGMAGFALPEAGPVEAFLWNGKEHPLNGYNCTGSAMLLGEWGHARDPRAEALVARAGQGYVCDLGFTPLVSWTCDDLLPYYVGYSLPAVFGEPKGDARKRAVKLSEYVAYDCTGRIWSVPRPVAETPP